MDFFGIGGFEMIAILVVALLVLGPERMVDVARTAGKWWREAQLAVRTLADAATTRLDEEAAGKRTNSPPRDPVPSPEDVVARGSDGPEDGVPGRGTPRAPDGPPSTDNALDSNDGPRNG